MARERSIVLRLKAEISDFQNSMGQASRSLSDFEKSQQKLGGAATTTMGRLAQSAKINEQQWTTVGRTMLGVGTGMAAIGAAALKTGIDYNNLQQTATKSLESVTGSTEAAAAQMDKLHSYGQDSWLMRDVLIRAQQNMSGFGIETSKVIPYMDALAEAVAGTSGSQQNFEDLAQVMGKIQSQGKITARELNEFGLRGIDAAQMIGDAMGMTADEIRTQITAGALDAETALDALAEGMSSKFEGSSDRLRDTWQGAFDNLKAAWRDLAADFAKPLVDPEGGGALVTLTNKVADFMNALQDLPGPVKTAAGVIGALATAATLGGAAFALGLPKYVRFREALADLSDVHPRLANLAGGLGRVAAAAGKVGGIVGVAAFGMVELFKALNNEAEFHGIETLTGNLEDLAEAGKTAAEIDLSAIISDMPNLLGKTTIEAENLGDVFDTLLNPDLTDRFVNLFGDTLPTYMEDNRQIVETLDDALTEMLNAGGNEESAALEFIDNLGLSATEVAELLPGATEAIEDIEAAAANAEAEVDEFAGTLAGVSGSADEASDAMENWIAVVESAGESFGGILDAFDAVMEKNDDLALSSSQTMEAWIEQMQEQAAAVENWRDNTIVAMDQIAEEVPKSAQDAHLAFVEEMVAAGEEGAEALQTFVDGTPEQRQELVDAWEGTGPDINDVIEAGLTPVEVEGDTDSLEASFNDVVDLIESAFPTTSVDADVSPARGAFNSETGLWESTTTDTNLDANTAPAYGTTTGLFAEWMGTTTDTNLDANDTPARGSFDVMTGQWMGTTTDTNLDANTGPAAGSFNSFTGNVSSTQTNTKIGADTSPAASAWASFKSSIGSITTSIFANFKTGKYDGGWINPGRYEGGTVQPGLNAGGWVPGERAGYDNVLWPLHSGGQVLAQPLEGREFVVNSRDAARYPAELNAMNNGTYPTGTLEQVYSPTSAGNVTVTVPPVDTSGIREEVRAGFAGATIRLNIAGREFDAMIVESNNRSKSLGVR